MPDLTADLLHRLKNHSLPGVPLKPEDGFLLPRYDGQSVLNLPSTVCSLLGVPPLGARPLLSDILIPLSNSSAQLNCRRVILILMDALALHRFRRWMIDGTAPLRARLVEDGVLAPLTSIVPSTTATALTTLWTGRSPAEHAVLGYEMWLKEYGVLANMITHAPASFQGEADTLAKAGFDPETFLQPHIPLGSHLTRHGVKTYAFQPSSIVRSGLSQMLFRDVDVQAFNTISEMWINVRMLHESQPRERLFVWVYWGLIDHFSHYYGPDDERPAAEFAAFTHALQHQLLSRLSLQARQETVLLLTADHGVLETPKSVHNELANHPRLLDALHMAPSGEGRLPYLFIKPGESSAVTEYTQQYWPDQFLMFEPSMLVKGGLFGSGKLHPRLFDRLGDMVVIPKGNAYWWWANKENKLLGRHGGLSPEEMLVPLAGLRLG
jgi:predicted AlkP superfamily pyrophosphatase or phosphodiesterase